MSTWMELTNYPDGRRLLVNVEHVRVASVPVVGPDKNGTIFQYDDGGSLQVRESLDDIRHRLAS